MADIDYRPRPPFKKSGTVISPRTVTDTLTMYRGITSAPTTTGTLLDFVLETEWTTGSLINADFAGATVQSGDYSGLVMDFNTNLAGVTDLDVTGISLKTPALTQSAANTTNYIGMTIPTAGALVQDTLAGTINWKGLNIQCPNITQTTGTVNSYGLYINGGTVTSGTQWSMFVDSGNVRLDGTLGNTTNRVLEGWFTDLTVTNNIAGSITGNAATVTSYTPAGGSLTLAGADAITLNTSNVTNITLPTSGTLMANIVEDTTPQLGGDLDMNKMNLSYVIPTTDGTASGPIVGEFVSGYTSSAIGDLVYLDSSSKRQKADKGTSVATYGGLLGIALEVKATDAALKVALAGSFVYCTAFPALTIGSPVYMDDAGAIVVAQPAEADHAIRVVGYAVHADKIRFNPSDDYVIHA